MTPQQQKVGGHAAQEQQANSNTQQQQLGQAAPHPPLPHGDSGNDSQASAGTKQKLRFDQQYFIQALEKEAPRCVAALF